MTNNKTLTILLDLIDAIKTKPEKIQIQLMWTLIQMLLTDVETLKVLRNADFRAMEYHAEICNQNTPDTSAILAKLHGEIEDLVKELKA